MRMWKVDPRLLCHQHLLGEHKELHMFVGCMRKGLNLRATKYVSNGLVEVHSIPARHEELVAEFHRREYAAGTNHATPIPTDIEYYTAGSVDVEDNLNDLMSRCPACRTRIIAAMKPNSPKHRRR